MTTQEAIDRATLETRKGPPASSPFALKQGVNSVFDGINIPCSGDNVNPDFGNPQIMVQKIERLRRSPIMVWGDADAPTCKKGGGDGTVGSLELGSDCEVAEKVKASVEAESGRLVYDEGAFWTYRGTHWEEATEREIRLAINSFDGASISSDGKKKPERIKLSEGRVRSILAFIVTASSEPGFFAAQPAGINCASGFIRFAEDGEPTLEPHSPELRCRHVLAGRWTPEGNPAPQPGTLLSALLTGCFKGDEDTQEKADLLAEIAGVAAAGYGSRGKQPKAAVLYGKTAENGKSQVLDMISGLLPKDAISNVSPGQMGQQEYAIKMAGKLLNTANELSSSKAIASDIFKYAVTGEPFSCRKLHHNPVEISVVAQHIFATNVLPNFQGGFDRGVRRRLLILPFNRKIPIEERVEHIGKRIAAEEMDLLLAWAVAGANRAIKRGHFADLASCELELRAWIVGADKVLGWIDERVDVDPSGDAYTEADEAYRDFRFWCDEVGDRNPPSRNSFGQRLLSGKDGITKDRLPRPNRTWIYRGMALRR